MRGEGSYLAAALAVLTVLSVVVSYVVFHLGPEGAYPGTPGARVAEYRAELEGLALEEEYVYAVKSLGLHMLYRSWPWRLAAPGEPPPDEGEYVLLGGVSCPPGFTPYYVGPDGRVKPLGELSEEAFNLLASKVYDAKARNEVGCFNPKGVEPGVYRVGYTFYLAVPLACGPDGCAVLLELAKPGGRLAYDSVEVVVRGASLVAVHPASEPVEATREGDVWVLRADGLPLGVPLKFYAVYPGQPPAGVEYETVDSAVGYVESRVALASAALAAAEAALYASAALVAASPALLLAVYLARGRERRPRAPPPAGLPPRTGEKPWHVAALYAGGAVPPVDKIVAAVAADLAERGVVEVVVTPSGPALRLPDEAPEGLDPVERAALDLLRLLSRDGLVTRETAREAARRRSREAERLVRVIREEAERLRGEAVEGSGRPFALLMLAAALASLAGAAVSALLGRTSLTILLVVTLIASFIALVAYAALPPFVLGRWRPGYLERYLAWREYARTVKGNPATAAASPAYAAALGAFEELKAASSTAASAAQAAAAAAVAALVAEAMHEWRRHGGAAAAGGAGGGGGAGAR